VAAAQQNDGTVRIWAVDIKQRPVLERTDFAGQ
jgi:hypothetical protein